MSVNQDKRNGTWRARWYDADGRQRSKTFRTKTLAKAHVEAMLTDRARGAPTTKDAATITVEEWSARWLDGARNLGQGGRDTYRRDLDRHILPALGGLRLRALDTDTIDAYLTGKLDTLAPSTVHRHYRTIRRMMAVAQQRDMVARNPCDAITPPRQADREMRFLSAGQLEDLADAMPGRYRAWCLTAGWGGMRWSELVGLRKPNVDGRRVVVAGQMIRRDDGEWHEDAPKTRAGRRTVSLPSSVGLVLAAHIDEHSAKARDGLVFPNQLGNPLNGPSFRGNVWVRAVAKAGLEPGLRIHDLRHTAAALAILAGGHPKAIQARLGHASITMTLDRYGHLFPEMDEDLADRLDEIRGR